MIKYYQLIETGESVQVWNNTNTDIVLVNEKVFWPLPASIFVSTCGEYTDGNQIPELISIYSKWWKET